MYAFIRNVGLFLGVLENAFSAYRVRKSLRC